MQTFKGSEPASVPVTNDSEGSVGQWDLFSIPSTIFFSRRSLRLSAYKQGFWGCNPQIGKHGGCRGQSPRSLSTPQPDRAVFSTSRMGGGEALPPCVRSTRTHSQRWKSRGYRGGTPLQGFRGGTPLQGFLRKALP